MSAEAPLEDVRWERVGARAVLADEGRLKGTARGWHLLVVQMAEEAGTAVYAVENRCSHATARLDSGEVDGCHIICPLHGARFDIRNGACAGPPASQPIRSFPARINGEDVEVAVPEKPPMAKPKFGVFN
ncbi:MAG: Rieske 2Fe-2S domain-containing protein [Gammaproteobacteria bacterium]|nr:Rieske 2Fe-2S domain-containing protein [Gammaproteobacteria bacterium]